jgi:hypothetical protein
MERAKTAVGIIVLSMGQPIRPVHSLVGPVLKLLVAMAICAIKLRPNENSANTTE